MRIKKRALVDTCAKEGFDLQHRVIGLFPTEPVIWHRVYIFELFAKRLFSASHLVIAGVVNACDTVPSANPPSSAPKPAVVRRFPSRVSIVLDEMWREFPEQALRAGNRQYADQMSVPDQAARNRSIEFQDRQLAALARYDLATFSAPMRVDYVSMKNGLQSSRWNLALFKAWRRPLSTTTSATNFSETIQQSVSVVGQRARTRDSGTYVGGPVIGYKIPASRYGVPFATRA